MLPAGPCIPVRKILELKAKKRKCGLDYDSFTNAARFAIPCLEHLMPWYREIDRAQWRTLIAAQLGWMLDAMDVMLYSFALTAIRSEFQLNAAAAGALGAAP